MNAINISNKVWQNPIYFIAFGFGSGLIHFAPGTWGTLAAIPLYLLMQQLSFSSYLLCVFAAFLLGVYVCDKVSSDLGVHDYAGIVWDEVVGYLITMLAAPAGLGWLITGFILFRIFDIWKPQPIRFVDRYAKGGLGIMLDDVLAGLFAWMSLQGLAWVIL